MALLSKSTLHIKIDYPRSPAILLVIPMGGFALDDEAERTVAVAASTALSGTEGLACAFGEGAIA
jgi:hypothetical protein